MILFSADFFALCASLLAVGILVGYAVARWTLPSRIKISIKTWRRDREWLYDHRRGVESYTFNMTREEADRARHLARDRFLRWYASDDVVDV